jgi:hypothetical protein
MVFMHVLQGTKKGGCNMKNRPPPIYKGAGKKHHQKQKEGRRK